MTEDYGWEVSNDEWKKLWSDGKTEFHSDQVDPCLTDFYQKFRPDDNSASGSVRVFVPLCGKDPGMRFLYEKGMDIVGVEVSDIGCRGFFEENKIEFTEQEINDDIKLFKSKDDRICLYCCDFFAISVKVCGQFDAVWDRGALNAVNQSDVSKYATLMSSLMSKNCVNLTVIDACSDGTWVPLDLAGLKNMYEPEFSVQPLRKVEGGGEFKDLGITGFDLYEIKGAINSQGSTKK